ncbi:HAMP domain-containing protein [Streptomyces albireticuli]|nr:HAMP domain-containing protein [Streptomyces albireticuli]MCD9140596.1 HAMP domain-containing protein [Streptomyces albireticuli]MCD9161442.1 HAMP domain-containing protein [Streptomyces albireticuli]MCD9192988.1 HAMP domain-containing protein [Streptomyces albireticuli]
MLSASRGTRRRKIRRRADMPLLGGARPPIAALLALLLAVAGATALVLGDRDRAGTDTAVLGSQQRVAEDGALSLRASLDESVTDLQRAAALFAGPEPVAADTALDKLGKVYNKWRGTAVIDPVDGTLLAARGENIPLAPLLKDVKGATGAGNAGKDGKSAGPGELTAPAPQLVRLRSGETRMLVTAPLRGGDRPRLLVASGTLNVPGISTGENRSLLVVDSAGTVLASDGPPVARTSWAKQAARTAASNFTRTPEPGGHPGASGHLMARTGGGDSGDRRTAVGYAAAGRAPGENSPAGGLGLSVITSVKVTGDPAAVRTQAFGLVAAGVLLVLALVVTWVLMRTVQRPLLQLYLESRRLGRGELDRPVRRFRGREPARIGAALESLRRQSLGERPTRTGRARGGFGTRGTVIVCGVLLLAWAAPLLLLLNRAGGSVTVPKQLVEDQRRRTDTAADRVRKALNEGWADVASVAQIVGAGTKGTKNDKDAGSGDAKDAAKDTAADRTVLETTLREHPRYRAVYVLDGDGKVVARAGASPRHPAGRKPYPDSVAQLNTSGKEPAVAAYAAVPDGNGRTVVGEYDPQFLVSMVTRPGLGQVWLVDKKHRVIAADRQHGFRAFSKLPGGHLDSLAAKARKDSDGKAVLHRSARSASLAAAAPFTGGGAVKGLEWQVVSEQPTSWLKLPEYTAERHTMLAGLLGVTAAVACLGWLHIIVIRPLRSLADKAEALAAGDRKTVLFPQHHDEVGAVVRNLELIRQRLARPSGRN